MPGMQALSVGIFPYVLKLLASKLRELQPILVFIWAKILAVDSVRFVGGVGWLVFDLIALFFASPCFPCAYLSMCWWYVINSRAFSSKATLPYSHCHHSSLLPPYTVCVCVCVCTCTLTWYLHWDLLSVMKSSNSFDSLFSPLSS